MTRADDGERDAWPPASADGIGAQPRSLTPPQEPKGGGSYDARIAQDEPGDHVEAVDLAPGELPEGFPIPAPCLLYGVDLRRFSDDRREGRT